MVLIHIIYLIKLHTKKQIVFYGKERNITHPAPDRKVYQL